MAEQPDSLVYRPSTLLVFIDETGHEAYADSAYPVFGRGGCIVMGSECHNRVNRPWKKMLAEIEWGDQPFHTADFVQRLKAQDPATAASQMAAINRLADHGFFRFGVTTDYHTDRDYGVDGHLAVSLGLVDLIRRMAGERNPSSIALIFESSDRTDGLVRRDFSSELSAIDLFGRAIPVDGLFASKSARIPGLELADLLAHTAGDTRRYALRAGNHHTRSFKEMFQKVGPLGVSHYWAIDEVVAL